ncbi:MAG: carboxypeptidase regulatory-like domain-containing protein [Endomicrobia bacterium]|nr:carboxypeptidase regulatory-like domain-containing protein [Endomicrobiia bacterium]MCL2506095.1 carboxypeptidase regulatory-like domain-containing protein [Endomicrobiia bacterium]
MKKILLAGFFAFFSVCTVYAASYKLVGFVTDSSGNPLDNITVSIRGGAAFTEKTDFLGYYKFENIPKGAAIEVYIDMQGLVFAPATHKIKKFNSDKYVDFKLVSGVVAIDKPVAAKAIPIPEAVKPVPVKQPEPVKEISAVKEPLALPEQISGEQPVIETAPVKKTKEKKSKTKQLSIEEIEKNLLEEFLTKQPAIEKPLPGEEFQIEKKPVIEKPLPGEEFQIEKTPSKKTSDKKSKTKELPIKEAEIEKNPLEEFLAKQPVAEQSVTVPVEKTVEPAAAAVSEKYSILGVVSDNNKGLGGVLIEAVSGTEQYKALTDDTGYFELINLPGGRNYVIKPSKDTLSFTPPEIGVNNLDGDKLINFIVSSAKFTIFGKVLDSKNKPVPSAKVGISAPNNNFVTLTDKKGAFDFSMPAGLSYTIKVFKDGYQVSDEILVESLSSNKNIDFVLQKEGEIRKPSPVEAVKKEAVKELPIELPFAGTAVAEPAKDLSKAKPVKLQGAIANKKMPMAGITVVLEPGGFRTVTDPKGKYSFNFTPTFSEYILKPDSTDISFDPEYYEFKDFKKVASSYDFKPYIVFEGSVLSNKKPVPDATVMVNGIKSAVTDASGKFRISAEYGSNAKITVSKEGFTFSPAVIDISNASKNYSDMNFVSVFLISGKVSMKDSDLPAANVVIEVSGSTQASVTTDFHGKYIIAGLEAGGKFRITPKTAGFVYTPKFIDIANLNADAVNRDFTAAKQTFTVKGSVSFGGKPVTVAVITVSGIDRKIFADKQGKFEIQGLSGGSYKFAAESPEHKFEPVIIENLQENTVIEFSNNIFISGIVRSGSVAMEGVTVTVGDKKSKTDTDGRFKINVSPGKDHMVVLSGSGMTFKPSRKSFTNLKESVIDEVFEASIIISGKVTADGNPVSGASIKLNNDAVFTTDENGNYFIRNLPAGKDYILEVSHPGFKFSPAKKELKNVMSGRMAEDFTGTKAK